MIVSGSTLEFYISHSVQANEAYFKIEEILSNGPQSDRSHELIEKIRMAIQKKEVDYIKGRNSEMIREKIERNR